MDKRFVVCALVVSLMSLLLGLLVHGVLLRDPSAALGGLMRGAEASAYLPQLIAAHPSAGFGLTWLYRQIAPHGERSLTRGLRFGMAMVLAAVLPGALLVHTLQPAPVVLTQALYASVAMLVLGLLLGYLNPRRASL